MAVVRVQCANVLEKDDLAIAGEDGRKDDRDDTRSLYLDTRILGDGHVLAYRAHIMSQFGFGKPPDEETQFTCSGSDDQHLS